MTTTFIRYFIAVFFGFILLADTAAANVRLDIKRHVVVQGKSVLLHEIAVIHEDTGYTGPDLKSLSIGRSPLPGQKQVLNHSVLKQALRSKGVPMELVQFTGASETIVVRESRKVTSERITKIVRNYILANMPWPEKDVEIQQISGARNLVVAGGDLSFRVVPQQNNDYVGLTPFRVVIRSSDGEEKQLWVTADIRVYTNVVVARHPIGRLREIGREDVMIERRSMGSLSQNTVSTIDEVIGMRTRSMIRAGDQIRLSQVEVPPIVRRGDLVTLKVENDSFLITALGKVLENGRPGELIRVLNISSKKEVYGQAVDGGTVKVAF